MGLMKKHGKGRAGPRRQPRSDVVTVKGPSLVAANSRSGISSYRLDPRAGNFLDYMLNVHSSPDQVELRTVCSGRIGQTRDAQNIRRYFQRAIAGIAAE